MNVEQVRMASEQSIAELINIALSNEGAVLCDNGALVVKTGSRTGRSPQDRFIVQDTTTEDTVAWGAINQPFSPQQFQVLWEKVERYLHKNCFHASLQVGADADFGVNVQVRTEKAWHNLFLRHLFIPHDKKSIPEKRTWELISAPGLLLDPEEDGVNSDAAVILHPSEQKILIAGMRYAGEMKKSMFSALNYILPERGVLPMHCSANIGAKGDVALFFGLSGTGKTTLSADPKRALIGDDEHGWGPDGIFNFEGGCYAKCIDLSREKEPVIWDAIRYGSIIENVVLDAEGVPDYTDVSITENIRAAYPRTYIANKAPDNRGGHPSKIFFLSCDLYGVLPPVAKLTPEQAAYYFLSGYTAKVGSTEVGASAGVSPTFSVCFGEPFFPRDASVYAECFMQKLADTQAEVYLINTGWTGGAYGKGGERFALKTTRTILHAVLENHVGAFKLATIPYFRFMIPEQLDGVAPEVLDPRLQRDTRVFDQDAAILAQKFRENFTRFTTREAIVAAGPSITENN